MKMTLRQRILTGCAVVILGATVGWASVQMPTRTRPMPEVPKSEPAPNQIVDLSEETLRVIAELIEESR